MAALLIQHLRALPWPLPALLTWALAWALLLLGAQLFAWWGALLLACAVSTAASLWGSSWWRRLMIAAGFPLSFLVHSADAIPAWGWLLPLTLLLLVYPLNAWRDAPVFPTPRDALQGLPAHIELAEGALVLDAGCGMGDGLIALHSAFPGARLQGLEWSWPLTALCALRCRFARVRRGDIWLADWSPYQLVYLFQRPESMGRAAMKAATEMRPGSWLVSLDFALPGVEPLVQLQGPGRHCVRVYAIPLDGEDQALQTARKA